MSFFNTYVKITIGDNMKIERLIYQNQEVNVITNLEEDEQELIDDSIKATEDTIDLTEVLKNE